METIKNGEESVKNISEYDLEKLEKLKGVSASLIQNIETYIAVMEKAESKGINVYIDFIDGLRESSIHHKIGFIERISIDMNNIYTQLKEKYPEVADEAFKFSETFNRQLNDIIINNDNESNDFSNLSCFLQEEIYNFVSKYMQAFKGLRPKEEIYITIISLLEELDFPEINTKMPIISEYKDLIIEYLKKSEAKGRSESAKQKFFESHQELIKKESDFKDFLIKLGTPLYFT